MKDMSTITTYEIGVIQAHAHRQLQKYSDEILARFGITKMQWLVVGTVLDAGAKGVRISDLAKKLGTTLPYLTNTVNLLESKQILARNDHSADSRAKLVTVDKGFKSNCAEIEKVLRQALRESLYVGIDPKDLDTYVRVLYKLAKLKQ
jgi:DNA-binding MarR family transcriptional regulator